MLAPVGIVISLALTLLAVIGIWEKDQPKYFGIGGEKTEKLKASEYVQIIKENKPMQRLMVAGAGCKLALSIATNTTVLCMLYGCMMGNYDGLYLPMMVLGYVFSVPFFLLTVRTSQKKGQKASLMRYVSVALVCYVGVLVLLMLWGKGDGFTLSIMGENGPSINLYTILFILLFGIGYGAYYATADMPIPMVADCSDYETYQSGKYIPGIMGTLFSLVDKLVSSLSATVVGIAVSFVGLQSLPTQYDPYTPRYERGGHRAVLRYPDGRLGGNPDCHEGLYPDRREDEGNSGRQCLPPRCRGGRHEHGGRDAKVCENGGCSRQL